jgi:hypothetical protein
MVATTGLFASSAFKLRETARLRAPLHLEWPAAHPSQLLESRCLCTLTLHVYLVP